MNLRTTQSIELKNYKRKAGNVELLLHVKNSHMSFTAACESASLNVQELKYTVES